MTKHIFLDIPGSVRVNRALIMRIKVWIWWKYLFLFILVLSFASRYTIPINGSSVRIEYILVIIAITILVLAKGVPNPAIVSGWALIVAWLIVSFVSSILFSPIFNVSFRSLYLLISGGLTLFVTAYFCSKWGIQSSKIYLDVWFIVILIGVGGCLLDILMKTNYFSESYTDIVTYRRVQGLAWEPNFYGISAMMLGVILWDRIVHHKAKDRSSIFKFLIAFIGVLISGTRSAQLVFFVGLIIDTLFRGRLSRRNFYIIALVSSILVFCGLILVTGIIHTSYTDRIIGTILNPSNSSSLTGRISMYRTAWDQMSGHYILGHGANSYGQVNIGRDSMGNPIYGRLGGYIGSLPLSILFDTGLVGVVLFFGWLVMFHANALFLTKLPNVPDLLFPFLLASILMLLTFFTTDGILLSFPWVHMGMIAGLTRIFLKFNRLTDVRSDSN